jgi:ribosomal protein S18 acetylase RimI-like enzyme
MHINIREFTEADSREVSDLAMTTFQDYNGDDYFSKTGIQKVLDSWNHQKNDHFIEDMRRTDIYFLAVEPRGSIVGLIRGTKNEINSLFVKGDFHNNGIGRILMERFESEAHRQGSHEIRLESSIFATLFYEKMNFEKTSILLNYEGLKVYSMKKYLTEN